MERSLYAKIHATVCANRLRRRQEKIGASQEKAQ